MIPENTLATLSETILSTNLFPVVGVGASAGGLEAFKKLITGIPENSGMAFVLVQHLDPTHESILTVLLQKNSRIPVLEITDEIKVEPNHIYVIPSNKMLVANDGILELTPRDESRNKRNLPIDLFFTSLAEVHQTRAIGVVLSGTGIDGTAGLKAIKDYGGITLAQDEESAAYSSMPNSAVQAGVVDFILAPEGMPEKISEISNNLNNTNARHSPVHDSQVFNQIISLLRIRKGTDFTYYKQPTIRRRILRRMAIIKIEEPSAYLKFLRENKTEQDTLYQDLLIPVTSFFRDEKVFDHLCEIVFPSLIKNKSKSEPIRIWIAGCSTGEEAFSIAICFKEFLGDSDEKVQIFATDLSEPAITKARHGIYNSSQMQNVSPQRLKEYFIKKNDGFHVHKIIRDMCVFAVHNFLKDSPFGRMDFISCRNVLIYMEPYLQKKAMTIFHYALNQKGILLLGKSETTSGSNELFKELGKTDKLFERNDVQGRFTHFASGRSEQNMEDSMAAPKAEIFHDDFQKAADDIVLKKYSPVGVIVNESLNIVHFRGQTNLYLEQLPGKPSHNLLKMAKQGLSFELRTILHKVKKEKVSVIKENINLQLHNGLHTIAIEAIPLPDSTRPYYLILFHKICFVENGSNPAENDITQKIKDNQSMRIVQLEKELAQTHEDMRNITEYQETANEELQRDNEELLSGSEELQSLNEELETSKEELQSTNKELTVVNHEIINLNELVTEARDYAEAIVATIREPLLVLDKYLRVQKANAAFYKTFGVKENDTEGVLIYDLGNEQWNIPALRKLLEKILPQKSSFKNFEITNTFSHIGERVMLLNAREINNTSEKLILLAIVDITEQKKAQEIRNQLEKRFQFIADAMPQKVWTADAAGNYDYFNKNWLDYTNHTFDELKNLGWEENIHPDDYEKHKKEWQRCIKSGENFEMEERFLSKDGTYKWHLSRGVSHKDDQGKITMWVGTNTKIEEQQKEREKLEKAVGNRTSELKKANETLVQNNEDLEKMNNELQSFTYVSSHDLQEPLRKIQTFAARILETEYNALSDNGKDYFQRMSNTARRMQTLIQDLLAYSHINSAKRTFENTDLNLLLEEVKNDLGDSIEEKKAIFNTRGLGFAIVNPIQFRQLLQNLISNSIKFAKPGVPPNIIIKSEMLSQNDLLALNSALQETRLSRNKSYYHITFSDDGLGFDPKYSAKIFEVFQRLHSNDTFAGNGIGLSIVKKIIENHNGIITASAAINNGVTFNIYIPTF